MSYQKGKLRRQSHLQLKQTKNLEINLTEGIKDWYLKDYMNPEKEIEEDTNKWEHNIVLMVRKT